MVKVITMIHKAELLSLKHKDIVNQYIILENLNDIVSKKKISIFVIKEYNRIGSSIYREDKLPVKSRVLKSKTYHSDRKKAYNEYLKSAKWINFRNKIKLDRGNKCEICSISGVELHGHHLTYVRFMNELESDIQILCKQCHKDVHTKPQKKAKRLKTNEPKHYSYTPIKVKKNKVKVVDRYKLKKKRKAKIKTFLHDMNLKEREAMREKNRAVLINNNNR
jgi:5-methylcytosine-specific restriction endonuclease McrA